MESDLRVFDRRECRIEILAINAQQCGCESWIVRDASVLIATTIRESLIGCALHCSRILSEFHREKNDTCDYANVG